MATTDQVEQSIHFNFPRLLVLILLHSMIKLIFFLHHLVFLKLFNRVFFAFSSFPSFVDNFHQQINTHKSEWRREQKKRVHNVKFNIVNLKVILKSQLEILIANCIGRNVQLSNKAKLDPLSN